MEIPFLDLAAQYETIRTETIASIAAVIANPAFAAVLSSKRSSMNSQLFAGRNSPWMWPPDDTFSTAG